MNEIIMADLKNKFSSYHLTDEQLSDLVKDVVYRCAIAIDTVYENAEPDHGCYDWATFADSGDILIHFGMETKE